MTNTRDESATVEFAESVNVERLRASQAFRAEQYRQACLDSPEMVEAYEREIERRRAARVSNQERLDERRGLNEQ